MPQYFSPGVYVEEVDAGPRPIQGVSTSVTGAVGVTLRGPLDGKPVLVTSFNEFVQTFGGFLPEPEAAVKSKFEDDGQWWLFPHAVKGFFDNGGQQLYVKRVVSSKATPAKATLKDGVIAEIVRDAKKGDPSITVRHAIGLQADQTGVKLVNGVSRIPIATIDIKACIQRTTEAVVTLKTPLSVLVKAGDYLEIPKTSAPTDRLMVEASSPGEWGEAIQVTVRPHVGATLSIRKKDGTDADAVATTTKAKPVKPSSGGVWDVQIKDADIAAFADGDTIRIDGRKYQLAWKSGVATQLQLSVTGGAPTATKKFKVKLGSASQDILANADNNAVKTAIATLTTFPPGNITCSNGPLPAPITITFDPSHGYVRLSVENVDLDNGAVPQASFQQQGWTVERDGDDDSIWPVGTEVRSLRAANVASTSTDFVVSGARRIYREAMVELDNGKEKDFAVVTDVDGEKVKLNPAPTNSYFEGDVLRIIEAEVIAQYSPKGGPQESEVFQNLKLKSTDNDDPLLITNRLDGKRSRLVVARSETGVVLSNSALTDFPFARSSPLADGDNQFGELKTLDFIGEDGGSGHRTGIQALEDIEDISIVMVPGIWSEPVVVDAIRHCEAMRYRVAVLDAPYQATVRGIQEHREQFDSSHAALYHPWVSVLDPIKRENVDIPPSGHIAGIWADVDTRRGVHKAPANEVIKSIVGLQQDINRREQDLLNPKGINALRFFPGRANRVWGARTISSDTNFKYINVRRIFNFIERSIDEGTQFVVFEPNDDKLWSRVRQTVHNFLNTQWRAGILEGKTADEAFYVACDRGVTMSQDDIENGRLICEIGISPVYPAEFVIFRIQKYTAESKLK